MTITGSVDSNGTYDGTDFFEVYWNFAGGLSDYYTEMVGQATATPGKFWRRDFSDGAGDFNFWSNTIRTETENPFQMAVVPPGGVVASADYQILELTHMQALAAVPEPSTFLLFGTGILGLAGFSKRKSWAATPK
jgi:hypothetical protein